MVGEGRAKCRVIWGVARIWGGQIGNEKGGRVLVVDKKKQPIWGYRKRCGKKGKTGWNRVG